MLYDDLLDKIEFDAGVSNTVSLSCHERELARDLLLVTEARIKELDDQLYRERFRLQRLRIAIAPHKLLPQEIITEIFTNTATDKWTCIPPTLSEFRSNTPWTLRHICEYWRRIARGMPRLWNHIHLSATSTERPALPNKAHYFRFLNREILSPHGPIILDGRERITAGLTNLIQSEIMLPNCQRLVELGLSTHGVDLNQFLGNPGSIFPSLKSLKLASYSFSTTMAASQLPQLFYGLTNLRHIDIDFMGPLSGKVPLALNIPWAQLTSIEMTPKMGTVSSFAMLNVASAAAILRKCDSLVRLKIAVEVRNEDINSHLTPIYLPFLCDLTLIHSRQGGDFRHAHLGPLMDSLYVPALTRLELLGGYIKTSQLCKELISFITRSHCILEDVCLLDRTCTTETLETEILLGLLTSVHTLQTKKIAYSDKVLRSIQRGDLLPMLQGWEFSANVNWINFFEEIIQTRKHWRSTGPPLSRAEMYIGFQYANMVSPWNKHLQKYGPLFKVCIYY